MKTLLAAILLLACAGPPAAGADDSTRSCADARSCDALRPGLCIVVDMPRIERLADASMGAGVAWNIDGRSEIAVTFIEYETVGCAFDRLRDLRWRIQYRRFLAARGSWTFFAAAYLFESFSFSSRLRLADIPRKLSLREGGFGGGAGPGVSVFPLRHLEVAASYAVELSRTRNTTSLCGGEAEARTLSPVVNLAVVFHF